MQKDIIHNDPLDSDEENRAVGVGITVTIPFRNADEGAEEE
ncbi:hypothetical protein [Streptomyces mangrovisoli]|nr:hypothetical protein [Streptomyces mangrovisoli]